LQSRGNRQGKRLQGCNSNAEKTVLAMVQRVAFRLMFRVQRCPVMVVAMTMIVTNRGSGTSGFLQTKYLIDGMQKHRKTELEDQNRNEK
jgi:hypothetical protein